MWLHFRRHGRYHSLRPRQAGRGWPQLELALRHVHSICRCAWGLSETRSSAVDSGIATAMTRRLPARGNCQFPRWPKPPSQLPWHTQLPAIPNPETSEYLELKSTCGYCEFGANPIAAMVSGCAQSRCGGDGCAPAQEPNRVTVCAGIEVGGGLC